MLQCVPLTCLYLGSAKTSFDFCFWSKILGKVFTTGFARTSPRGTADDNLYVSLLLLRPIVPAATLREQFVDMPHNSAIVMWAGCQERYKHSVPAMPKGVGTHPMAGEMLSIPHAQAVGSPQARLGSDTEYVPSSSSAAKTSNFSHKAGPSVNVRPVTAFAWRNLGARLSSCRAF